MSIIIIICLDLITASFSQCNMWDNYRRNTTLFGEATINHYFISIARKGSKIALLQNSRATSDAGGLRMRQSAERFLLIDIADCGWIRISMSIFIEIERLNFRIFLCCVGRRSIASIVIKERSNPIWSDIILNLHIMIAIWFYFRKIIVVNELTLRFSSNGTHRKMLVYQHTYNWRLMRYLDAQIRRSFSHLIYLLLFIFCASNHP